MATFRFWSTTPCVSVQIVDVQISVARNSVLEEALADWSDKDRSELARLVRKLADEAMQIK
ncbi:hypothetical protein [Glaciimonas soli]|uniref:MarR family transcriptional regulator n=1 Tax=Glaciimonas soli TaxID=2590999 RepID=A0A843YWH4_9BURK|nr:hypothetical protein [Glaciimonas soli]MQR02014.1 hypothetical protein [Glaciimonas soli]